MKVGKQDDKKYGKSELQEGQIGDSVHQYPLIQSSTHPQLPKEVSHMRLRLSSCSLSGQGGSFMWCTCMKDEKDSKQASIHRFHLELHLDKVDEERGVGLRIPKVAMAPCGNDFR